MRYLHFLVGMSFVGVQALGTVVIRDDSESIELDLLAEVSSSLTPVTPMEIDKVASFYPGLDDDQFSARQQASSRLYAYLNELAAAGRDLSAIEGLKFPSLEVKARVRQAQSTAMAGLRERLLNDLVKPDRLGALVKRKFKKTPEQRTLRPAVLEIAKLFKTSGETHFSLRTGEDIEGTPKIVVTGLSTLEDETADLARKSAPPNSHIVGGGVQKRRNLDGGI